MDVHLKFGISQFIWHIFKRFPQCAFDGRGFYFWKCRMPFALNGQVHQTQVIATAGVQGRFAEQEEGGFLFIHGYDYF